MTKKCEHEIRYSQEGMMYYLVSIGKDGFIEYEQDEFDAKDCGIFYCQECDKEFEEVEAMKILKSQK